MELTEFISSKQNKNPNVDIIQRWNERIIRAGLQNEGEEGAQAYLSRYGTGIAAPKCILMARQAENSGYPQVALGFWKKAFQLEMGNAQYGSYVTPSSAACCRRRRCHPGYSSDRRAQFLRYHRISNSPAARAHHHHAAVRRQERPELLCELTFLLGSTQAGWQEIGGHRCQSGSDGWDVCQCFLPIPLHKAHGPSQ